MKKWQRKVVHQKWKQRLKVKFLLVVIDVIWVSNSRGIVEVFAPNPSVANGIENELYSNLHMANITHNTFLSLHNYCSLMRLIWTMWNQMFCSKLIRDISKTRSKYFFIVYMCCTIPKQPWLVYLKISVNKYFQILKKMNADLLNNGSIILNYSCFVLWFQ